MIKFKTKQVIDVGYWDHLVESTYGKPYSFQQQDGCKERQQWRIIAPCTAWDYENENIPEEVNGEEMGVSFAAWLARDPAQLLNAGDEWDRSESGLVMFWERNFYPNVDMIVNDLHAKGILPTGEYLIDIDW